MSQENVEIVRQLFEHWERGDWRGGRDLMVDGCEFVFSTSWFPDAGVYKAGPEALNAWIAFTEAFDEFATGADQIIEAGEGVVALAWLRGRGRASGADVDAKTGAIFTLRDGKIVRCELTDRREALKAAGLREWAMSDDNVEIVRRYLGTRIDALDEQALDRAMQVFHPEVEFRDPKFPEAGVYRGHDALRSYARQFSAEFDAFSWEAEDILDAGEDQILVLLRVRGRGKGSGADVDIRGGWLLTLTEASVVRVDAYLDRRDALEAAGLSE